VLDRITLRWSALTLIAVAELAWIRLFLDFPAVIEPSGPASQFISLVNENISISTVGALGITFITTFLLVLSRHLDTVRGNLLAQDNYRWWPWMAGHVAAVLVFISLSWPVFGPTGTAEGRSLTWLVGWLTAATGMIICLWLSAAPASAWWRLARQQRSAALLAMLAGLIAWGSGHLAQELWTPLTAVTLQSAYRLLSIIYGEVYIDPAGALLGVNAFLVEIGAACSGYEGMALITVFVSLYLWLFSRELRFPHALLLLPIGIIAIFAANLLRIVALVAIGASISPEIAIKGFHSQAGWIGFSIVALAVIAATHRYFLLTTTSNEIAQPPDMATAPATALLTPQLVLLGSSMLVAALSGELALLYPVTVAITVAVLWYFRHHYKPLLVAPSWRSVAIGIAVFLMWIVTVPDNVARSRDMAAALAAMPIWLSTGWIIFRALGSIVTVPIVEELAFRGYLTRRLIATDFECVAPGTFTWLSFLASSVLFGLMHDNWLAGTLAGAAFALALYQRGQIIDSITAHMTSNALIALLTLTTGNWQLWG
jgi:exosortase E/protease (VPEID-CTERM system)